MFQRLRQRLRDMGTIKALCEGAERHARAEGQAQPAAEHFVLAALDLPDGSARRAFERANADPAQFKPAVQRQYELALQSLGVDDAMLADDAGLPTPQKPTLYRAQPSGDALMQRLAASRQDDPAAPLLGAHVVAVAASTQHGVVARALRTMNLEPHALVEAARRVASEAAVR
nr:Clp protease N-terminal domain-containing protein [uncultured Caldimonas sp.]